MTALMYQYAADGYLTLSEAKAKLHDDAYIRTAAETLSRYCGIGIDDTTALKKRVTELLLESDPTAKKDSVDRKVRTWLNSKVQFISRESAVQIIFALNPGVTEANEMLRRLCGEEFHRRDPEDIILLYALEHGMTRTEAGELMKRMEPLYKLPEGTDDKEIMTESIKEKAAEITTEEELAGFLREYAPHLGKLHNTAYSLFMDFMSLLKTAYIDDMLSEDPYAVSEEGKKKKKEPVVEEQKMTAGDVVVTYLYNNLIPRAKKGKNTDVFKDAIQRDIQQNWPDEYALSRMTNRETDVTRKVLILLFLACDGGDSDYADHSDETAEDIFEDTYARLSSMLADCGFSPLDPRNPFDWMVLYCMVADDFIDIDENIPNFLSAIFRDSEESSGEE